MPSRCDEWEKLRFGASQLRHDAFADWFLFGERGSGPLILYIGGAIPASVYQQRATTRPDAIADEFSRALEHLAIPNAELLVLPCPLSVFDERPLWRTGFSSHVRTELLPARRPDSAPSGCVGYSMGSFYAFSHFIDDSRVARVATVGGVGMADVFQESGCPPFLGRHLASFANENDKLVAETDRFAKALAEHGVALHTAKREGYHAFKDYAANDSIRDAFAFALEASKSPDGRREWMG